MKPIALAQRRAADKFNGTFPLFEEERRFAANQKELYLRKGLFRMTYIRKMPNLASGITALYAADNPSANAFRVSTGSRIPSSQSLAVE